MVVVHGYSAEAFLYAQTLSRLVTRGFKVVAVDMAGHGSTQGLPMGGDTMAAYADLLLRTVDELGIRQAVFAGHSMGGRVVAELAASVPDRVVALVLLDAIVGDLWDGMVGFFRLAPWLMAPFGAVLVADTVSTVPALSDREQAFKIARLAIPTYLGHALRPWRLVGPVLTILRSSPSKPLLDRLAEEEVPVFVIHGERDLVVPLCTAKDAARRTRGQLVVVRGATHSWLLKDPETLPAIVEHLLAGRLGEAVRSGLHAAGAEDLEVLESTFYRPGARILEMTPPSEFAPRPPRDPRYRWTVVQPSEL